ncbi:hypothetical protein F5880DRAFT_1543583 [Lentinula raphanica]|nr:hypothetical protein F5880DRAFT_1543583 [Lentinula raphanica]
MGQYSFNLSLSSITLLTFFRAAPQGVQVYRPLVPESKTTDRKPTQAYVPSGLKANVDKKPLEFYVPSAPFRSSTVTKPTGRQPVLVYDPRGTVKITNKNGKPVAFYVPSGAPPHT